MKNDPYANSPTWFLTAAAVIMGAGLMLAISRIGKLETKVKELQAQVAGLEQQRDKVLDYLDRNNALWKNQVLLETRKKLLELEK